MQETEISLTDKNSLLGAASIGELSLCDKVDGRRCDQTYFVMVFIQI